MENQITCQDRSVQPKMPSARTVTKLDTSTRYAKKRAKQRANLVQTPKDDDDTHINENGIRQPNPPKIYMFKLVNHIETNRGRMEGKHLKFLIASHPKEPYKYHTVVSLDTGADVNCMNEKTFNELFPEVQVSVCPHENFRNSVADISILGQFCTYLKFRGEKYQNTFIVTNMNDFPNLLSYGATFRMGVLLLNYPEENVGDNVPIFSKVNGGRTGNGTAHSNSHCMQYSISCANTRNGTVSSTVSSTPDSTSNVFQILEDIQKRRRAIQCQYISSTVPTAPVTETPFGTTTPSTPAMTATTAN